VGEAVVQDGTLYVATPIDPLLLLLPLLEHAASKGMFQDLESILENADLADAPALAPLLHPAQVAHLSDCKEAGGQEYYRLNEDRALGWLKAKTTQAAAALAAAEGGAFAAMDLSGLTAYAAGLVGEYVSPRWRELLWSSLELPDEAAAHPPPHIDDDWRPNEKRARLDPKELAKTKAAAKRQEERAAKLAKEAAGMRKLSAFFFKPKPKAP
jgi:ribonuclease H2 subunit B